MSTTSMAIFSNPLFATYSVYARNAFHMCKGACFRRSAATLHIAQTRRAVCQRQPSFSLFSVQRHCIKVT